MGYFCPQPHNPLMVWTGRMWYCPVSPEELSGQFYVWTCLSFPGFHPITCLENPPHTHMYIVTSEDPSKSTPSLDWELLNCGLLNPCARLFKCYLEENHTGEIPNGLARKGFRLWLGTTGLQKRHLALLADISPLIGYLTVTRFSWWNRLSSQAGSKLLNGLGFKWAYLPSLKLGILTWGVQGLRKGPKIVGSPGLGENTRHPAVFNYTWIWLTFECWMALWNSPGKNTGGKKKIQGGPIPFSRGSSQPKDQTQVSCITGRFFTREALDVSSKC